MNKITQLLTCFSICTLFIFSSCTQQKQYEEHIDVNVQETQNVDLPSFNIEQTQTEIIPITKTKEPILEKTPTISDEEIELIALVTMAEAESECEEGQRLVIDTILNRVDSKHFPNTIYEVIYQPNQFTSMWNGRVNRCEIREDICELVLEELESRNNADVIFFTAGRYSNYGTPMFQIGNHYFSSYS